MSVGFGFKFVVLLVILVPLVLEVGAIVEDVEAVSTRASAIRVSASVTRAFPRMLEAISGPGGPGEDSVKGTAPFRIHVRLGTAVAEGGLEVGDGGDVHHVFATGVVAVALLMKVMQKSLANPLSDGLLKVFGLAS